MFTSPHARRWWFWLLLTAFVGWDFLHGPRPDVWSEPPWFAAGSGQAPSGGHCSMAR